MILTTAGIGVLSGGVGGAFVGLRAHRRHGENTQVGATVTDDSLGALLDEQANAWAEQTGRPEAARLVARKLRLAYAISAGKGRAVLRRTRPERSW